MKKVDDGEIDDGTAFRQYLDDVMEMCNDLRDSGGEPKLTASDFMKVTFMFGLIDFYYEMPWDKIKARVENTLNKMPYKDSDGEVIN